MSRRAQHNEVSWLCGEADEENEFDVVRLRVYHSNLVWSKRSAADAGGELFPKTGAQNRPDPLAALPVGLLNENQSRHEMTCPEHAVNTVWGRLIYEARTSNSARTQEERSNHV